MALLTCTGDGKTALRLTMIATNNEIDNSQQASPKTKQRTLLEQPVHVTQFSQVLPSSSDLEIVMKDRKAQF